ncbi:MAG: hypothetical protein KAU38_00665, partial [Desulfobacterales bacterium]|nr:hypothetical protein [Desulfobacterales bacterium]
PILLEGGPRSRALLLPWNFYPPYFCVSAPALLRLTREVLHPVPNDATRRLTALSIALLIDSEPFSDVSDVSHVASIMIRYDARWQS